MIPADVQAYIILPILIFLARIADVSFGTLRIIFISRGLKLLAPVVGFFEISIWLVAISQVLTNMGHYTAILAYASGFAVGNYVGILIEEKMAMGISVIRIITQYSASDLIEELKNSGFRTTVSEAQGQYGPVSIIYSVVKRKQTSKFLGILRKSNPNAFYTIEDVRNAGGSVFVQSSPKPARGVGRFSRKSK
ncbi:MAG: DUF2179 domain-containing protein [Methanomicrobiaceae archaeon]|nr:DUF2179 domain-containing protein [Methanomicrobiaceae archaeon]